MACVCVWQINKLLNLDQVLSVSWLWKIYHPKENFKKLPSQNKLLCSFNLILGEPLSHPAKAVLFYFICLAKPKAHWVSCSLWFFSSFDSRQFIKVTSLSLSVSVARLITSQVKCDLEFSVELSTFKSTLQAKSIFCASKCMQFIFGYYFNQIQKGLLVALESVFHFKLYSFSSRPTSTLITFSLPQKGQTCIWAK